MLRAFGAFLVVFSILSLLVQLKAVGSVFAMAAISLLAVDELMAQLAKTPRVSGVRAEPSSLAETEPPR
jgi:hypothetical protein